MFLFIQSFQKIIKVNHDNQHLISFEEKRLLLQEIEQTQSKKNQIQLNKINN